MATFAPTQAPIARDDRFFMITAIAMAAVIVSGFSFSLAMGRSTFASPLLTHAHAVVFMGWVVIYLLQTGFASTGAMVPHRLLGWIATGWVVAMVVLGCAVTVSLVQRGHVPFVFPPLQFLVFDPLTVFVFAGLTFAAVANRSRTDWHRRLHYSAMSLLLGPAIGRLMPLPLLIPYAHEAVVAMVMVFPLIGMAFDVRRRGAIHPASLWGAGVIIASAIITHVITFGPLGPPLYRAVTAGTPGAVIDPLAYPARPTGALRTGHHVSM